MVDQPEIFIAPDSKYKGMKPDEMKALSDSFGEIIIAELSESYRITDTPGPDVLYIRVAVSNLHVKKQRRVIDFTPIGVVKNTAKALLISDVTKKISLIEVTVEAELLDSQTGERIAAIIEEQGQAKDKEAGLKQNATSWKELKAAMQAYSKRLLCRMDNARIPESQHTDCRAIK